MCFSRANGRSEAWLETGVAPGSGLDSLRHRVGSSSAARRFEPGCDIWMWLRTWRDTS